MMSMQCWWPSYRQRSVSLCYETCLAAEESGHLPWSTEIEYIAYPVGENTGVRSSSCIWPWILEVPRLYEKVIEGKVPYVDTSP